MLELVGLSLLFFTANVAIGLVTILAARELTAAFLSVYTLNGSPSLAAFTPDQIGELPTPTGRTLASAPCQPRGAPIGSPSRPK